MKMNKPSIIEPGLLSLFRIFIMLQWGLLALSLLSLRNPANAGASVIIIIGFVYSSVLILYLRSKRLQRWFRRFYLPIALFIATATPIFMLALSVQARLDTGLVGDASANEAGTLVLWLLAPLVAIATQYGFRTVLVFVISTTGLELFFGASLADAGSVPVDTLFEQILIRNLIFIAIGFIISRLITEQRRQRASLREANEKLAQYALALEQLSVSRERNRMARDLHDTLAHTLSAVAIQLEAVTAVWETSPDDARQRIDTIREVTRDGLGETRRALQALRSSPLDDLGLAMSMQMMAEKASERAGFRCHFHADSDLPDLSLQIELNIYRIAEEALNNIVQHAQATDVWCRLDAQKNMLVLQIRDNGIGFDSEQTPPEGHFGLVGMTERAEICGGTLKIESEPTIGTKIRVMIGTET